MAKTNISATLKKLFIEEDTMPKSLRKGKSLFIFCMVIVAILNFLVFYVAVNVNSFVLAFQKYDRATKDYFFSLDQFKNVFRDISLLSDGEIVPAFYNTMIYFWLNFLVIIPLSFLVSYFLYKKIVGYKFYRVIFYMPSIISAVVLVAVFKYFILPGGALDSFLIKNFDYRIDNFLLYHDSATVVMVIYTLWTGFGTNIVLYQSAMKRVPESVVEAAKLDGVTLFQEMFSIITPLVWPTVVSTLTIAMSAFFTASGPILLFTEGTAETSTISFLIYWKTYKEIAYNYAAAIGIVCTIVGLPIVFAGRWFINRIFDVVEY